MTNALHHRKRRAIARSPIWVISYKKAQDAEELEGKKSHVNWNLEQDKELRQDAFLKRKTLDEKVLGPEKRTRSQMCEERRN